MDLKRNDFIIIFQKAFLVIILLLIITLLVLHKFKKSTKAVDNQLPVDEDVVYLISKLKEDIVSNGEGLYLDNEKYVYKGVNVNNYVKYNGIIWRIVEFDENITLITDEVITSLSYGENNDFDESYIKKYLSNTGDINSGVFENKILGNGEALTFKNLCLNETCSEKSSRQKVGLLSKEQYENSKVSDETYIDGSFFLITKKNNNIYYVVDGDLKDTLPNEIHGIKPIIFIKGDVLYIDGDGSIETPYILNKTNGINIGDFVSIDDITYRIIDKNNNSYKIALDGVFDNDIVYSKYHNKFLVNELDSVAYYLNHEYYDSLNKEILLNTTWYNGIFEDENHDYSNIYSDSFISHVGLLNIGDFYINDYTDYYLMTPSIDNEIYVIQDYNVRRSKIDKIYKIRPCFSIKRNIGINGGNGTKNDPYILVTNEDENISK